MPRRSVVCEQGGVKRSFDTKRGVRQVVLESKKVTRRVVGELMGPSVVCATRDIWHES